MSDTPEHEARHIRQYVANEAHEDVISVEKIKTEGIFGQQYDVLDVRTIGDKRHWWGRRKTNRWWVVTNMTNLYSFEDFPSLDHLLSFHIGLMHRIIERQRGVPAEEPSDKFKQAWRRFGQAVDRFNLAVEAEDFQAVGNHLRECLLAFARDHAEKGLVADAEDEPQLGNFPDWSRLLVRSIAEGRQRVYLDKLARITWDLIQSLVHDHGSSRFDAEISLDAVEHFLTVMHLAIVGHGQGDAPRCPKCGSYQLASDYRQDEDPSSYIVCGACGWEKVDE
jgi:hypothetical protein